MDTIIAELKSLKEDKPHLIFGKDIIEQYIKDNMDALIDEIDKEINNW